jgi:hypothetical protein
MAHRTFNDRIGRRWDAWTVMPTKVERRSDSAPVEADRRRVVEPRVRLGQAMADGWLCFETKGEKRRMAPFPERWDVMTDEELVELCAAAELAPPPRRLVE